MSNQREYPTRPICGVGVVAFRDEAVLLVQRGSPPRAGEWSIPGGAVELGETVRQAAVREVREECGGEIELRDLVDVGDIFWKDNEGRIQYHYVLIDFWGEWRGGVVTAGDDVLDARWVLAGELNGYDLPAWTRDVINKAAELRAQAKGK